MDKLPEKIQLMKAGGKILTAIMKQVLKQVTVGVTGFDLETIYAQQIKQYSVESAFKGYQDYPYHLCLGVNDMVVHGFPSAKKLQNGDLLSVDMGLIYKGYYLDMARTVIVGEDIHGYQEFVDADKKAHYDAIKQAKVGNRIGDISEASQQVMEFDNPFSVVREMVGHGVGERLHMAPDVPGYGRKGTGPVLKEFQTLAVEIIAIRHEDPRIKTLGDGWQTVSKSGEVSAIYENTIYVGKNGGVLLTGIE